jgi:hypothetical protein
MQVDSLIIKGKLDTATTKLAPGGERPPPHVTIAVEWTYGELMLIWDAIALRDVIRDIVK